MSKHSVIMGDAPEHSLTLSPDRGFTLTALLLWASAQKCSPGSSLALIRANGDVAWVVGFYASGDALYMLVRDGQPAAALGDLMAWSSKHGERLLMSEKSLKIMGLRSEPGLLSLLEAG